MALLRKVKDKIKRIGRSKKISSLKPNKVPVKRTLKAATGVNKSKSPKEEALGAQETAIEKTKFSHPEASRYHRSMPQELPSQYGRDSMVLLVRDPWWLHTYWELGADTLHRFKNELKEDFHRAKFALRVYDVTNIVFNGGNANSFFDIYINENANNWFIDTACAGKSWCVDLGLKFADGRFITMLRSNVVSTPQDGPSRITDEQWLIPEEMFARLYGMGFGLGQSSPVAGAWQERAKRDLSSGGISSAGSPTKNMPKERKFRLVVDCELIVYGATEPDAKLTVQDKEVRLRPDGTFSLRFALPDGKAVISVKAVSSDKIEERTITPVVSRETKASNLYKEESAIKNNFRPLKK